MTRESATEARVAAGGPHEDDAIRTRSVRELFTSRHAALAAGVLLLEFSAGLSLYVSTVVVPEVIGDLDAAREYPLIVSATSIGLFLSLALAGRALTRFGGAAVLAAGLVLTIAGSLVAATALSPLVFAFGRLATALGSGLLGVFGTSTVIATVPQGYRVRLLALTSAMWILPGMAGPSLAVAAVHAVGWRWTLLMVVPLVLVARALVGRAALRAMAQQERDEDPGSQQTRLWVALLLPAGMAVFVFGSATAFGAWSLTGLAVAIAGAVGLLPPGTIRAAVGPPRALALLAVLSFGYFGAEGLLTSIATRADGIGLAWVSVAIGAAAVCWALGSMVQPRLVGERGERTASVVQAGLAIMTAATAAVMALQLTGLITGPVLLVLWPVAGIGMGFVYPAIYLQSTTPQARGPLSRASAAAILATAVLVAESTGAMLGTATGSAIVDVVQQFGAAEATGLHATMVAFTAALACALGLALLVERNGTGQERRGVPDQSG